MSTRREFLKTGGALVIGFSLRDELFGQQRGTPPGPDLGQIDTWIAIHSDNTATVHIGFCELGQVPPRPCHRSLPRSSIWT